MRRGGARRVLRWTGRIVAGALALAIALVLAVAAGLRTEWGRERVRRLLEARLDAAIVGDVRIGRVARARLDGIEVEGVAVDDAAGRPILLAERIELELDVLDLLVRRFDARSLRLVAPELRLARAADGALNLARLARPTERAGPAWEIDVARVVVERGAVTWTEAGVGAPAATLTGVELVGAVRSSGGALELALERARATWVERAAEISAAGRVAAGEDGLRVDDALITVAGSRLAASRLVLARGAGALAGEVAIVARAADVRAFADRPDSALGRWRGDVSLAGRLARAGAGASLRLELAGTVAGAPAGLEAALAPDLRAVEGTLRLRGLAPPRAIAGAPAGRVDVEASFRLAGRPPAAVAAALDARLHGTLAGVRGDLRLQLGTIPGAGGGGGGAPAGGPPSAGGGAPGGARIRTELTVEGARVTAFLEVRTVEGDLEIVAGTARVVGRDLTRAAVRALAGPDAARAGDLAGLRASGEVEVRVRGRLRRLAARGTARLRLLRAGALEARRVTARFDLRGLPGRPTGAVRLVARETRLGEVAIGRSSSSATLKDRGRRIDLAASIGEPGRPYALDAAAVVTRAPGRTIVELGAVELATRELTWRGGGGRVVVGPGGALAVDGLALESGAGRVALTGALAPRGDGRDGERVHVHATGLKLGVVARALAPAAAARLAIAGTVELDAHLTRRGRALAVDAELAADGLSWRPGGTPVDVRARLDVAGGGLRAEAQVAGRGLGEARLRVDVAAPREVLDLEGWRRLTVADARRARLELTRVGLRPALALAGLDASIEATLSGVLEVPEGSDRLELDLTAAGVRAGRVRGLDGRLAGRWTASELDLSLDVAVLGERAVRGALVLAAGPDALLARGPAGILEAPARGQVRIEDLSLDRLARAGALATERGRRPGRPLALGPSGRVSAEVELRGSLARPVARVSARARRARLGGVELAALALEGGLAGRRATVAVRARQTAGGTLAARGGLTLGGPGAAAARPFEADLEARGFDLAFLRSLAPGPRSPLAGAGGRLDAELALGGTLGSPVARGRVAVRDGRVLLQEGTRAVHDVELTARLDGAAIVLERLTARSGEGRITARGQGRLAALRPTSFELDVTADELPVQAGRAVVAVDLDAHLAGGLAGPGASAQSGLAPETWLLQVAVRDAAVRIPRAAHAELQAVGPLEDYVYVDARARGARDPAAQRVVARGAIARVRVVAPRGVAVRGRDVDAVLRVDLSLDVRATTSIEGEIEALRGVVVIQDRRYDIVHARATFDGEAPPDPAVDVLLRHEFEAATLFVSIEGRAQGPEVELSSNPAVYSEAQLLSFVLGADPDDTEPAVERPIEERALGLASNVLVGRVRSRLERILPIDILRVEVGGVEGLTETELQVGTWLTPDLLLRYLYRAAAEPDENINELLLEYRFARGWLLEARYGDRGEGSADLLWTRRY